ncbi:hypothetical protein GCM10009767_03890 [Kocuria aegyptia]|uniref:Uncharacterized protein n=1 Tax=Kocuria aegyptia TaxID=330943 RepID=A0ABN2K4S6_9MICC
MSAFALASTASVADSAMAPTRREMRDVVMTGGLLEGERTVSAGAGTAERTPPCYSGVRAAGPDPRRRRPPGLHPAARVA